MNDVAKPAFTLPDEPVDRYEVRIFHVELQSGRAIVSAVRYVYHVNSTWADVCPDRRGERGADFVNHWQCFSDGEFTGRSNDGWRAIERIARWEGSFATREEANAYAVHHLRLYVAEKHRQIEYAEEQIAALLPTGP